MGSTTIIAVTIILCFRCSFGVGDLTMREMGSNPFTHVCVGGAVSSLFDEHDSRTTIVKPD